MFKHIDQIGNHITLKKKPVRIVSLVPSQSEFLWDLGLGKELVGITKFCIHPKEMHKTITHVGGTKKLNLEKIRALKPDLIIGNKEENEKAQIDQLQKEFPIWMSDIYNFEDAFGMMRKIGVICEKEKESERIVNEISNSLLSCHNLFNKERTAYFIWRKPYMLAGGKTFIGFILNYCGLTNTCSVLERYPELDAEELRRMAPEICFLSSEPFPFKEKHVNELQEVLPGSKIILVDGEVFSWYGTRLLLLEKYLFALKKQIYRE